MPWSHASHMDQKLLFISAYLKQQRTIVDLAFDFGISRKTAYKWIDRYLLQGPAGLEDRSKAAIRVHNSTPQIIVDAVLAVRKNHPTWGGKKILRTIKAEHPTWKLPSRATVCDILKRHGLTRKARRRRKISHPGKPTHPIRFPNDLWAVDFKGQFKTKDGLYCYPLTVTDAYSRYLLGCQGALSPTFRHTQAVFKRLFKKHGLPNRIRSDNGTPFASQALARLSKLSVWWIRLGIFPELIEPGKPQQNGSHERMHKTLKAEATRPPAGNLNAQQRKLNTFQLEFNTIRPHESLNQETPASIYCNSNRKMPERLPEIKYPSHFEIRYVSGNGCIRWKSKSVRVATPLIGEYIGLESIDDGMWNVYFSTILLGIYHERNNRIEDSQGKYVRRKT
jgi:putative transposase